MIGHIALLLIGALLALAGAWVFYVKDLRKKVMEEMKLVGVAARDVDVRNQAIHACWSASFGGYGAPPALAREAYNSLWRLVGLEEKGAPSGG